MKLVGGVFHMFSFSSFNILNVTNCYFTLNYGIMGGVYDINLYGGGQLFIERNTYFMNLGYDFKNHVGAGSVFKILMIGSFLPPIISKNNKYISNMGELRGK